MQRYETNRLIPTMGGLFAVLATAATLAAAVVLPVILTPNTDPNAFARRPAITGPTEIAIVPGRIEVIGWRRAKSA